MGINRDRALLAGGIVVFALTLIKMMFGLGDPLHVLPSTSSANSPMDSAADALRMHPNKTLTVAMPPGLSDQLIGLVQGAIVGLLGGVDVQLPSLVQLRPLRSGDGNVTALASSLFNIPHIQSTLQNGWRRYCGPPGADGPCTEPMRAARVRAPGELSPCFRSDGALDGARCQLCTLHLLHRRITARDVFWPFEDFLRLAASRLQCTPLGRQHVGTVLLASSGAAHALDLSEWIDPVLFRLIADAVGGPWVAPAIASVAAAAADALRSKEMAAKAAVIGRAWGHDRSLHADTFDRPALYNALHLPRSLGAAPPVVSVLHAEGISPSLPLYVASGLDRAALLRLDVAGAAWMAQLFAEFPAVQLADVLGDGSVAALEHSDTHEVLAALEFAVVRGAQSFVAYGHSQLAAIELARRRSFGAQPGAAFAITPLAPAIEPFRASLPVRPNVFTAPPKLLFSHSLWPDEDSPAVAASFAELQAAVAAAHNNTRSPIVCIFEGPLSHLHARWLTAHGVRVVPHERPPWASDLLVATAAALQSRQALLLLDAVWLGLMDEFVVLALRAARIRGGLEWAALFSGSAEADWRLVDPSRDVAGLAAPGTVGPPRVVSLCGSGGSGAGNVAVLNLRALREDPDLLDRLRGLLLGGVGRPLLERLFAGQAGLIGRDACAQW